MAISTRALEVSLVDQFLADQKALFGNPPEFGGKRRGKQSSSWEAIWPIANSLGIVESGQLRIVMAPSTDKPLTIAIIFNGNCIFRVDFVSDTIGHLNPWWAQSKGLPPRVSGPHVHEWAANREHWLEQAGRDIPCRSGLPPQIRRFDQALPWLAERTNLVLTPEQRQFQLPANLL